jgi:Protein kinase domain
MSATVFQRIGPYDVVEEIGRGGMAAVFLARDSRCDRRVALKLIPVRDDREGREILEAERWGARLQEQLSGVCDLVPRVHEDVDLAPYYAIAMEYVDGENLSDVIGRGQLEPAEAARIAIELCRFLDVAHRFETTIDGHGFRALVHGDLKPRNVRVTPAGEIKVLDFGIAKALSLSRRVTRNDFGSMPYLSPERLESTEVDAHADLWALGVILYELLSGAAPFYARDTRRLEQQIRNGYGAHPLTDPCPIGLQAIVAQLLAPRMGDRYPAARAVQEDLERFGAGQPTIAQERGWPRLDEATRRTRPAPAADVEATRRTAPEPPPPNPAALPLATPPRGSAAGTPPPPAALSASQRWFGRRPLRTMLMLVAFVLVVNEVAIGFSARRAAAGAMTRDLDGLSDAWTDYAGLSRHSYLRVGISGLERALSSRSQELAEQVIANYRGTTPTVRERQWKLAQRNLQQALRIAPGNATLRAALRYCEGHLHRIDGEAEKARHRTAAANQQFADAVTAFREAAELRREWPDPFLGLARTFIYGLDDIDRGAEAMRQAQRWGYTPGDRETVQLGDGYRARAETLSLAASQLADLPQEREYLQRAVDAYQQALTLYERVPAYSGVAPNIRRARRALEQIERRLSEIAANTADGEEERQVPTANSQLPRSAPTRELPPFTLRTTWA